MGVRSTAEGGTMAGSGRRRRKVTTVMAAAVGASAGVFGLTALASPAAFATTQAFELYCPGTPVGNIALNNVVVNGTVSPASPAAGSQFNLTGFQTSVALPSQIVTAAAALGNSAIAGSAVVKVDATGATPASVSGGNIAINSVIPSPVPSTGLTLTLPSSPATIGPFTASSSGTVSLTLDPSVSLTLNVSGSNLSLTCNPYPNNTVATGIVTTAPSGAKAAPVIATVSVGGGGATPTTTAPAATPTTSPAPATSPSTGSLASTGPGPDLWIVAIAGFVVLYLGSVALAVVERPRSLLRRLLHLGRPALAAATAAPASPVVPAADTHLVAPMAAERVTARTAPRPPDAAGDVRSVYPGAGDSPGLWFDGCQPEDRTRS